MHLLLASVVLVRLALSQHANDHSRRFDHQRRQSDNGYAASPIAEPRDAQSAAYAEAAVRAEIALASFKPAISLPEELSSLQFLSTLMPPHPTSPSDQQNPIQRRGAADGRWENPHNLSLFLKDITPPRVKPSLLESIFGQRFKRQSQYRILCVGDSITHGGEGDFTWRYRLWEWLRGQGVSFQYVGPYLGTQQPDDAVPPQPPPFFGEPDPALSRPVRSSGGYSQSAAAAFTRNAWHFAVWGRAAATDRYLIRDIVTQHQTDVMLLMLGFNDMGWFYSGPYGTFVSIGAIVEEARAVNPNMRFVIANVPQRTSLGRRDLPINTETYNGYLRDAVPNWSQPNSPITLAEVREEYSCELDACPAAYDGLHPNSLGDYQIARAFSRGLIAQGIGQNPLGVPRVIPTRPLNTPTNFRVVSCGQGFCASWDRVYGTSGYDIRTRVQGQEWSEGRINTNAYWGTWTIDGATYEMQVRASHGQTATAWTAVGSAVSRPRLAAPPQTAIVTPNSDGFTLEFSTPTGPNTGDIRAYNVIFWDRDAPCSFLGGAAFRGSPARLTGLTPGHRYLTAIATWNENGGGNPAVYRDARVGSGAPRTPQGFRAQTNDPTTAHLTWNAAGDESGYQLYQRNLYANTPRERMNHTVDRPCNDIFFLFPGTWNYEFCVQAYNGRYESALGECVRPPQPSDSSSQNLACPPPPEWCPDGGGEWGPNPENPTGGGGGDDEGGDDEEEGGNDGPDADTYDDIFEQFSSEQPDYCDDSYSSIDAVESAYESLPLACTDIYVAQAVAGELRTAIDNYNNLLANDYAGRFDTYARASTASLLERLRRWTQTRANDYFTCVELYEGLCCSECQQAVGCEDCIGGADCVPDQPREREIDCPDVAWDIVPGAPADLPSIRMDLDDDNRYFDNLLNEAGIQRDWVTLGTVVARRRQNAGGTDVLWYDVPIAVENPVIDNPGDIIRDAIGNGVVDFLVDGTFLRTLAFVSPNSVSPRDLIEAYPMPAMLAQSSIDVMNQVVELADEIEEEQRTNTIIDFVSAVLLFVPFLGQLATAARIATLGRTLSALAGAGEAGLIVYDAVQDPSSLLFLALAAIPFGRSRSDIQDAARGSRDLDASLVSALPRGRDVERVRALNSPVCARG